MMLKKRKKLKDRPGYTKDDVYFILSRFEMHPERMRYFPEIFGSGEFDIVESYDDPQDENSSVEE